ncbi:hypothetical protein EBT25_15920, partial [bacterium]|nr:hypothetical protein [bacterium]
TCEYKGKYYVGAKEIMTLLNEITGSSTPADSQSKYVLYYAAWCGYSKKILPIWESLTKGKANFQKIEEKDMSPEISKHISGFPTMIVDDKEMVVGYDNIKARLEMITS